MFISNFLAVTPFISRENDTYPGQKIIIIIHDIWDLPLIHNVSTGQSCLPAPFVAVKTAKEAEEKIPAKSATHVAAPSR